MENPYVSVAKEMGANKINSCPDEFIQFGQVRIKVKKFEKGITD